MKILKIVLSLAIVSILLSCQKKNQETKFVLTPPFPGLETKFSEITVDNNLGDTILLPGGSYLSIPANCFVDTKGKKVDGKIVVMYRQFNDAVDIFLSGIPMSIQSAGYSSNLQTTGMFELRAKKESQLLQIAPDKTVDVFINTKNTDVDYNFFKLNDNSGNWEFVDYPESQSTKESLLRALRNKIESSGDTSSNFFIYNFDVLFDISKYSYKALEQKVAKYNIGVYNLPAQGELIWNDNYYLTCEMLWKDLDNKSFPSWLKKSDWYYYWFNNVEKRNNASYQVLSKESGNIYNLLFVYEGRKFTKRAEAIIPLKYLMPLDPQSWKSKLTSKIIELNKNIEIDVKAEAYKSFSIMQVGVYNFDRLYKQKDWFYIRPQFTLDNRSSIIKENIIMITDDNTSCFKLDGLDSIKFNPAANPRIFAILPENKIAVFPLSEFKKDEVISLQNLKNPSFNFKLIDAGKVENSVQLREILGLKPSN
jgi:hypothetical protein